MQNHHIGTFFTRETLNTELKQFCLRGVYDKFDESEMETLLQDIVSGNTPSMTTRMKRVLDLVPYSLVRTIENVVPKYATVFLNSGIHGSMYIGVSDCGEVTGVPWPYGMDISLVTDAARRALSELVSGGDDRIMKLLDVELIKVDPLVEERRKAFTLTLSEALRSIHREKIDYNQQFAIYKQKRCVWMSHLEKYSLKLTDLVNTPVIRMEFVEFVKGRCCQHTLSITQGPMDGADPRLPRTLIPKKDSQCGPRDLHTHGPADSSPLYPPFVQELERDAYEYYSFETRYYMQSDEDRGDRDQVWFWITLFKESKMKDINAMKPVFPKAPKRNASVIVSRLEELTPAVNEMGISHVILRIVFRGDKYNHRALSFRYPSSNEWYTKKRVIDQVSGEPVTVDI